MENWFLEGFFGSEKVLGHIPLSPLPFQVGRQEGLSLTVPRPDMSRVHAEFHLVDGKIAIRDFGSTNGTYVNSVRLSGEALLNYGDVIRFGSFEVRLVTQSLPGVDISWARTLEVDSAPEHLLAGIQGLQELLDDQAVTAFFQPIVKAVGANVYGYEVLGRGDHTTLPKDPGSLFRIAEYVGKAVELSELFRRNGVDTAASFSATHKFFINIHPTELSFMSRLLLSVEELRKRYPQLSLVLEIHEHAVSDIDEMRCFGAELAQMGVELAYDDFGAGQARLLELVEVPASYLKFDISLIHEIDRASEAHREMVALLLELARKMSIATLAEGLSRIEEVEICRNLGFDYFQGYYFGRPAPGLLAAQA